MSNSAEIQEKLTDIIEKNFDARKVWGCFFFLQQICSNAHKSYAMLFIASELSFDISRN